jgi:hypothetical protein
MAVIVEAEGSITLISKPTTGMIGGQLHQPPTPTFSPKVNINVILPSLLWSIKCPLFKMFLWKIVYVDLLLVSDIQAKS